jgi:hypothetical protein
MITIPLTLTRPQWVEVVHALATKIEIVDNISDHDVDRWLGDLKTAYAKLQAALEAKGVES